MLGQIQVGSVSQSKGGCPRRKAEVLCFFGLATLWEKERVNTFQQKQLLSACYINIYEIYSF